MDINSLQYAKENKRKFLNDILVGKKNYEYKDAIFMAGSPGAGKTEVAQGLDFLGNKFAIIDADLFRSKFPGYTGSNSSDFQRGASYLVDYTFTEVIKKSYSFILDGTFSIGKSIQNVERAINRGYNVSIYYVYQDPLIAWKFTKKREKIEGRFVPKATFINAYFNSRNNIEEILNNLSKDVVVNIVLKDYDNNIADVIMDIDNINLALPNNYTREELEEILDD